MATFQKTLTFRYEMKMKLGGGEVVQICKQKQRRTLSVDFIGRSMERVCRSLTLLACDSNNKVIFYIIISSVLSSLYYLAAAEVEPTTVCWSLLFLCTQPVDYDLLVSITSYS